MLSSHVIKYKFLATVIVSTIFYKQLYLGRILSQEKDFASSSIQQAIYSDRI